MQAHCRQLSTKSPQPYISPIWHGFLFYATVTVIWILHIDDIEVRIVYACRFTFDTHFVLNRLPFAVETCFADVEESPRVIFWRNAWTQEVSLSDYQIFSGNEIRLIVKTTFDYL